MSRWQLGVPGMPRRARRGLDVSFLLMAASILLAGCGKSTGEQGSSSSGGSSSGSSGSGTATVSKYDSGPRAFEAARDEELAEKGKALFQTKGCSACHTFGKKSAGPDLAGVSQRRTAAWMEQQILHPEVMVKEDPISHGLFAQFALQMPNQGLTPDEAKAVIEYFKHQDHEAGEAK